MLILETYRIVYPSLFNVCFMKKNNAVQITLKGNCSGKYLGVRGMFVDLTDAPAAWTHRRNRDGSWSIMSER